MSAEDFFLKETILDNSILKRAISKIYHQRAVKTNDW